MFQKSSCVLEHLSVGSLDQDQTVMEFMYNTTATIKYRWSLKIQRIRALLGNECHQ